MEYHANQNTGLFSEKNQTRINITKKDLDFTKQAFYNNKFPILKSKFRPDSYRDLKYFHLSAFTFQLSPLFPVPNIILPVNIRKLVVGIKL